MPRFIKRLINAHYRRVYAANRARLVKEKPHLAYLIAVEETFGNLGPKVID